jgi:uncharacterized protein with GYD domain
MAKFLIEASYTAEGLHGLAKDKASGRKAAVEAALIAMGGKLDSIHYAFGDIDVYLICDLPGNVAAASLSIAVAATGLVRTRTVPLLTIEEADQALTRRPVYRAPGA